MDRNDPAVPARAVAGALRSDAITARASGWLLLALLVVAVGCAAPTAPSGGGPPGLRAAPPRALEMAVNVEVSNLSPRVTGPWNPARTTRIFNAELVLVDAQENVRPYLAEALPALDTDSWRLLPDGRMETTWRLHPNLTWHDGQPLTADDFVFAVQVYRAPELAGFFDPRPQNLIEQAVALDARTLRLDWRSPFLHQGEGLQPLPHHLLSEPFAAFERDRSQSDTFTALRYWTTDYVGAGPYQLTGWEPASHIDGTAFDGHVLGRPKIERVVIHIIPNNNTALAGIMAGELHLTMTQVLRFEQAVILRQHGGFNDPDGKGRLIFIPTSTNTLAFQHRLEYQQTPALFDVRVRRAIAHATDREAIAERLFDGLSPTPISFVFPDASNYADVDRAITRYPYDPTRTEALLTEAGYTRDRDGFLVDDRRQRLQPALWNSADSLHQTAAAIVLDNWRGAGIDAQPFMMPPAMERDPEARATWPGAIIYTIGGLPEPGAIANLVTEKIAAPANRWAGTNRSGWSNPAFDRLSDRYSSTLVRAEQVQLFVQMMQLQSEQLPNYPLYFSLNVVAHVAGLTGPDQNATHWNIHQWEWTE